MARPPGHGPNFQARKDEIVDLAAQLFAERGYASTSLDDLGALVGLGKGALYHYIGSKEALLVEIQSRMTHPGQLIAGEIEKLDLDPLLCLRVLSESLLRLMLHRLAHISALEHDFRHLTGKNLARFHEERSIFEDTVAMLLARGMADGTLRQMDPRLAMQQFLNMHNYTYRWIRPDGPWTPRYLSGQYCETLFRGLLADGAHYDLGDLEARASRFLDHDAPETLRALLPGLNAPEQDRDKIAARA